MDPVNFDAGTAIHAASENTLNPMMTASSGPKGEGMRPREPGRNQHGKWRALERKPAGPVRHRREQKAAKDGRDIAEQHFVDVPVARRKGRR